MTRKILMWEHHAWGSPIRVGGRAFAERFLAQGWEVAWMNGPLAPWNLVAGNEEVARRRASWLGGGERIACGPGRLLAYAPVGILPYRRYPLLRHPWFHRHALDATIPPFFPFLEREGFASVDLLWLATGSPFLPLLDRVNHDRSLYRLSDETGSFPDTPASYARLEEEAMRRVDVVIATAASLAERASKFCRRVLLLPNGVDAGRFPAGGNRTAPVPASARAPRIVYVGALDSWLDRGKIEALARAFVDGEILLAGPVRIETGWAKPFPNVRWLGPVPPEEVPSLLAGCDVGIIPFLDTPLTRAIHPVKLYEYCAAGLPVVASDLDEIRRIGSPARRARTDTEWIAAVREAVEDPRRAQSRDFAARNDWSARFEVLLDFLELGGAGGSRAAGESAR
jgi:glycosyltransferase involved in cell wall biosynthesis